MSTADWSRYLDRLEAVARGAEERLEAGEAPDVTDLLVATPPPGPLPEEVRERAGRVLDGLVDVTARTRARRDALAAQLLAMPARRAPQGHHQADLGASVDVNG